MKMDARVVTLNPMTIMQNSLHGVFGCSGDIANVPPRAATIGPADVVRSRARMESHDLTTMGTFSSWQRIDLPSYPPRRGNTSGSRVDSSAPQNRRICERGNRKAH